MSDVRVRVDASEIRVVVEELERRGKNLRSAFEYIAEEFVAESHRLIETQGDGKWEPLKSSTLAKRRKNGRGARMLQDTGRLAGAIFPNAGGDFAEAYTNVSYGKFHVSEEHGASTDDRPIIPERDYFAVDTPDVVRSALDALTGEVVG